jgi:FKBP-type peptidyl-prolyl cis-trans isomerase
MMRNLYRSLASSARRPLLGVFTAALMLSSCGGTDPSGPLRFEDVNWSVSLNVNPAQFQELSTGIWVLDRQAGDGPTVAAGSRVRTHYRGWLPDGFRFDSSLDPMRDPLSFTVGAGQMIPGFDYGVRGMRPGGVRTVLIPPYLGYGARPPGGSGIPANSWLVFEIQLVDILP